MTLADPMTTWAGARDYFAPPYLLPPDVPPPEVWVRLPGADKPAANRGAGAMLTADATAVHLKDWTRGEFAATYRARRARTLDADELRRARVEAERRQAIARAEALRERAAALAGAQAMFNAAAPGDGHPYLGAKLLERAHGTRTAGGWLLVAGHDEHGALAFVQRIGADGTKRLVRGTSFAGAWATFGTPADGAPLVVSTGWATSAVVFEDTGAVVLAAMCDANVLRVARTARRLWPSSPLVVAGDDDRHGAKNSGREAGEAAARATGARVLFPSFCRPDCPCSDFADLRACERRGTGS